MNIENIKKQDSKFKKVKDQTISSLKIELQNNVEKNLFNKLDKENKGFLSFSNIEEVLSIVGMDLENPIIKKHLHILGINKEQKISFSTFLKFIHRDHYFFHRALSNNLAIKNFPAFKEQIIKIFKKVEKNKEGNVADYIPQLARVNPDKYAISICSVDGQKFSYGDFNDEFCVQSSSKPISYLMALEEHGLDKVHNHVGREPSGRGFNAFVLNYHKLPHNPMINSGAIMTSSLLAPKLNSADKFDYILNKWKQLTGGDSIGFSNPTYLSEKDTADRNFALGHFMNENNAFPKETDLHKILDLYFQICSITTNTRSFSVVAATLANGGVCPVTGYRIFNPESIRSCLSLMYSCGMYDYSGEFAFRFGLPAKSGVSGVLLVVVPNVMGVCIWSPRLDRLGNSVRGIEFTKEIVEQFNYHIIDQLVPGSKITKLQQGRSLSGNDRLNLMDLYYAATDNDLNYIKLLTAKGVDLSKGDYDGRTALHLAAAEGNFDIVKYLLDNGADLSSIDRWKSTPLQEAIRCKHDKIALFLKNFNK